MANAMIRRKRNRNGTSLPEILSALSIFGILSTATTSFFSLSTDYFFTSSAQVDTLSSSQQATQRLAAELQETDAESIQFSVNHDAVVFISARDSNGKFQTSNGVPNWQKWVCYYLITDPNGPYSRIIRKESASIFGGLPSTSDQTAPADWLSRFQSSAASARIVASGVQTFDIEDTDCGTHDSPLYIQVISSARFRGQLTSYNPGYTVNWGGLCSKTGNWVQAQVMN